MSDTPAPRGAGRPTAVLLVVDMQRGFAGEDPAVDDLAVRIGDWIDVERDRYAFVAASRFRNDPDSLYRRIVGDDMQDEQDVELLDPIRQRADVVFDSSTYSSFTEELAQRLRDEGAAQLHVCGIDTDQCVLATVFSAFDAGIEPLVIHDLCRSCSGDNCHEAGLLALRRAVGEERVLPHDRVWDRQHSVA